MKIRNGFVSNSSSSSFVIGVAKITDEKKFKEWVKKSKFNEWEFELVEAPSDDYKVEEESFTYDSVYVKINKGEKAVKFCIHGHDDSDFCDEDGGCYYDNDWELEPAQVLVSNLLTVSYKENGLEEGNISTGAGRNG